MSSSAVQSIDAVIAATDVARSGCGSDDEENITDESSSVVVRRDAIAMMLAILGKTRWEARGRRVLIRAASAVGSCFREGDSSIREGGLTTGIPVE